MKARHTLGVVAFVVVASSCSSKANPVAPTPDCELHNTALVSFSNTSASTNQHVIWDGVSIVDLVPAQTAGKLVVSAGVAHSMIFRDFQNRANRGCAEATPILTQCSDRTFTCGS